MNGNIENAALVVAKAIGELAQALDYHSEKNKCSECTPMGSVTLGGPNEQVRVDIDPRQPPRGPISDLISVQGEIDNLEQYAYRYLPDWVYNRLISILRRLANEPRPVCLPTTFVVPGSYVPPNMPMVDPGNIGPVNPTRPYIGDPMPGTGPTITCGNNRGEAGMQSYSAVSQADGDGLSHTD